MSTTLAPLLPAGPGLPPDTLPSPLPSPQPADSGLARARLKHAAIAVLSALTAMALFSVLAFHGYVAWVIAHPYVAPLTSNPMQAKGLSYLDVSFPSTSGSTMVHGWYIPAKTVDALPSKRTVVFSHGYGANREETWVPMYDLAALLNRLHYNVLMFDYGYASSIDRTPATGGYEESHQLLAAIHYAKTHGAEQLIVWGFSMGAGTALQAALQTNEIDAMLLDSLFLPSPEAMYDNVRQYLKLPRFPSLPLIDWMLSFWTGTNFRHIPAAQVMQKSYSIPLYIMHGTDDGTAPITTAEEIASQQMNPLSREWIVNGGKHELLFKTHPKEYIQRAALFLSQVDHTFKNTSAT
jgi:pimeloyl-ACP methyl ester carboxylesterase